MRIAVRLTLITAVVILVAGPGVAQPAPPLPPPRPREAPNDAPPSGGLSGSPAPRDGVSQDSSEADACLSRLRSSGFEVDPAEQPSASNVLCRIEAPVRMKAVPVPSRPGTVIRLDEHPILACRFAESFGRWLGDLVAPVIAGTLGTGLKSVRTGPGFECRNRNRTATGKLSAHAEGLAVDIAGFELTNGSTLRVKPDEDTSPNPALATVRRAACGWFTTVLGPGSDDAHHDHLHVDIQQHGTSDRYRICQ